MTKCFQCVKGHPSYSPSYWACAYTTRPPMNCVRLVVATPTRDWMRGAITTRTCGSYQSSSQKETMAVEENKKNDEAAIRGLLGDCIRSPHDKNIEGVMSIYAQEVVS